MGTAQLGLPYGPRAGRDELTQARASALLTSAWDNGIRGFDTASAYGSAEAFIGAWAAKSGVTPRVATKITTASGHITRQQFCESLDRAIDALGKAPECLLAHDEVDPDALVDFVVMGNEICDERRVRRFGLSTYRLDNAHAALMAGVTALQVAGSALDRRPISSGLVEAAAASDCEVMIRSVAMRGWLAQPALTPAGNPRVAACLTKWFHECERLSIDPAQAAIAVAAHLFPACTLVVGVDDEAQLMAAASVAVGQSEITSIVQVMASSCALTDNELDLRAYG